MLYHLPLCLHQMLWLFTAWQGERHGVLVMQGAGAEVQRPVYQMHAYPPGVTPPSTDHTPWGVALGQTLATPRMPDPQTSPPAPRVMDPAAGQGCWVQGVPGCGDAHASNSPSPAGEACLTTPTDLLLQVPETIIIKAVRSHVDCDYDLPPL